MHIAIEAAADLSPLGMALGEMIRTLDVLDKHLAVVCDETIAANQAHRRPPDGICEPS